MEKIICADYLEMSGIAADIIAKQIRQKPDSVIGFATGSTPIGTYQRLINLYQSGYLDFAEVTSFNLDEYYPLARDDAQSYYSFMQRNLFEYVNMKPTNINIQNAECVDPNKESIDYDAKIAAAGGIDLQILGIGRNGHIGFIEPNDQLSIATFLADLSADTIDANSRFFKDQEAVPKQALTVGVGALFSSRRIVLLISGEEKAEAVRSLFAGYVSTQMPATLLHLHRDVVAIIDRAAASMLS
jgi:glucosamine-6-phosphate deaminase